ncbi:cation efflux protein, CzcI-like [Acinetobacter rudis]|nr:cation efflux protein, CzcI-like [Acinetobacter rudis]
MRKSRIFLISLLSLFMFQAIWNVAAGFCLHEKNTQNVSIQHFGHHQSKMCEAPSTQQNKQSVQADLTQSNNSNNISGFLDDHHDHLPSFAHFIVVEPSTDSIRPNAGYDTHLGNVVWNNLYKSPLLVSQNPPPEYASL